MVLAFLSKHLAAATIAPRCNSGAFVGIMSGFILIMRSVIICFLSSEVISALVRLLTTSPAAAAAFSSHIFVVFSTIHEKCEFLAYNDRSRATVSNFQILNIYMNGNDY